MSDLIASKLHQDYKNVSSLFSNIIVGSFTYNKKNSNMILDDNMIDIIRLKSYVPSNEWIDTSDENISQKASKELAIFSNLLDKISLKNDKNVYVEEVIVESSTRNHYWINVVLLVRERDEFQNPVIIDGICTDVSDSINKNSELIKLHSVIDYAQTISGIGTWWIDLSESKDYYYQTKSGVMNVGLTIQDNNRYPMSAWGDLMQEASKINDEYKNLVVNANKNFNDCIDGKVDSFDNIYPMVSPTKGLIWMESRGKTVTYDESGNPLLIVCVDIEVTEKLIKQREIDNIRSIIDEGLNEANVGTWIANIHEGELKFKFSDKAIQMHGFNEFPNNHYSTDYMYKFMEDRIKNNPEYIEFYIENRNKFIEMINGKLDKYSSTLPIKDEKGIKWIEVRVKAIEHNYIGEPTKIVGATIDVTKNIEQQKEIKNLQNIINEGLEISDIGTWWIDFEKDPDYFYSTDSLRKILSQDIYPDKKYNVEEWKHQLYKVKNIKPEYEVDIDRAFIELKNCVKGITKEYNVIFPHLRSAHELVWLKVRGKVTRRDSNGKALFMIGTIIDMTTQILQEKRLEEYALYDSLTGLYNRISCLTHLEEVFKYKQYGYSLFIDFDNFKRINDKFGHEVGDQVVKMQAQRIKSYVGIFGNVYRLAGDEFFVYVKKTKLGNLTMEAFVKSLITILSVDFTINSHIISTTASIGISEFNELELMESVEEMINFADMAMYIAKREGKNKYVYATEEIIAEFRRSISFEGEIKDAIKRREFVAYYQPKIDIKTNKIVGAEALARWIHPVKGFIPPSEFIPNAELTGDVAELDLLIAQTCIEEIVSWKLEGLVDEDFVISFNFSNTTIKTKDVEFELKYLLNRYKIEPKTIEVEITETVASKNDIDIENKLNSIEKLGINLSLDDFSAGHSSVDCILRLPLNTIKFDRSLVSQIDRNNKSKSIYYHLSKMSKELDLKVVAEGIETVEQRDILDEFGTDIGQGFYYSKPISNLDFKKLVLKNNGYI